jgi:hypothetical protein
MRLLRWLGRAVLLALACGLGFLGIEYFRGRRGPVPRPTADSILAGHALLDSLLARGGLSWASDDTAAFHVVVRRLGRRASPLAARLEPTRRILQVTTDRGFELEYDPSTDAFRGLVPPGLKPLLPSLDFWTLVPAAFDDPTVVLWRLPNREGRARLAARWPGEADWFILAMAPDGSRLDGLEFVDARFGVFLRWRGTYAGPLPGAPPIPERWSFRAASPLLDALAGRRELVALEYAR